MSKLTHPLMQNNITREDLDEAVSFLQQDPIPQLTNGPKVREFEEAWSKWLDVKYSVFVNSGTAANQLTLQALAYISSVSKDYRTEIIVPPLTWVSDIASVLQSGYKPVFVDINLKNLSFDTEKLKAAINPNTRAIFLTHVLGINGLSNELAQICINNKIPLIEDVCESHGARLGEFKLGSFGFASNFSFYFAHHMSTIEGGMVCTNNEFFYQILRSFRSHGMVREIDKKELREGLEAGFPNLNKDFIFLYPAFNFRSTEINAVLGLSQLKKLDANNEKRRKNFEYFMSKLDPELFITDLEMSGQCNYAFIVILKKPDLAEAKRVEHDLTQAGIEFRRGLSGGGNQLRQPYLKSLNADLTNFPNVEHVHNCSWYIGNYPELEQSKIDRLLTLLNFHGK